jgi:hypothetical protein
MSDVPGLDDKPPEDELEEETEDDIEETEERKDEKPLDEAAKWRKRAERRETKLREAQAELAKLRAEKDGTGEPDRDAIANAKLVNAEARAQLAAAGVTEKDDQRTVIAVLNLSDVEVEENGEVDAEVIEERISELRRIFGKGPAPRRTPRVDTRDRGGKPGEKVDADSARFRRILGQGG